MERNFVVKVLDLRNTLDGLLAEYVTIENIGYALYAVYLVAISVYIFNPPGISWELRNWRDKFRALVKIIILNLSIWACIFLGIFIFPHSSFTSFWQIVFDEHPGYPLLSFIFVLVVGIIGCVLGILTVAIRKKITFSRAKE